AKARWTPLISCERKAPRTIGGAGVRTEIEERRAVIFLDRRPGDVPAEAPVHAQFGGGAPCIAEMQAPGVRARIPRFDGVELARSIVHQAENEAGYRVPTGHSDQAGVEARESKRPGAVETVYSVNSQFAVLATELEGVTAE